MPFPAAAGTTMCTARSAISAPGNSRRLARTTSSWSGQTKPRRVSNRFPGSLFLPEEAAGHQDSTRILGRSVSPVRLQTADLKRAEILSQSPSVASGTASIQSRSCLRSPMVMERSFARLGADALRQANGQASILGISPRKPYVPIDPRAVSPLPNPLRRESARPTERTPVASLSPPQSRFRSVLQASDLR
jgi:hypothetical protein